MKKLVVGLAVTLGMASFAHAAGDPQAGQAKTAVCAGCHGADGNSMVPDFPKLAGQNAKYLAKQIREIRDGARNVPQMAGLVDNLSNQDIADIAAYYASQSVSLGGVEEDKLEAGQQLYRAGDMSKGIPACTACHSPTGKGNAQAGFPALSGQHAKYTVTQLKLFRSGERTNDPNNMMRGIAAKMSDAEMEAVASYVSGLH